ncbi:MAG TPA: hypothetical protein VGF00_12230 [Acidimicrobiia bacterium]
MELGKWLRVAWDRAAALAVIVIGAVVVIIGWIGVSGEPYPAKQLPFMMSGGVGGMFLLGVGALFWLSSDLRDEWTKLDRIEEALVRLSGTDLVEPQALTPAAQTPAAQPPAVEPPAAEPQLAKVAE